MKIAVVGVGGIGGVLAATMTRAGYDVTPVVGNPTIADALSNFGYRVRELDGDEWSVPVAHPPLLKLSASDGPFDLLLCVTQSTTMEEALRSALPCLHDRSVVVVCQNGLPEARAAAIVGERRLLGGVVGWAASMPKPGSYIRTSRGEIKLGKPTDSAPDPKSIEKILSAASGVDIVDDLDGVRWSKLAINCVTTTLGAVGGGTLGGLLRHRSVRRLALEIFAEVRAVAEASGVRVQPIAGTFDIERIAITDGERDTTFGTPSLALKHSMLLAVGFKYRRLRSSMLYALERGRPPEIDFLNGEVARRGKTLGVSTPVNAALVDEVAAIAAGKTRSSVERLRAVYARSLS